MQLTLKNFNNLMPKSETVKKSFWSVQTPYFLSPWDRQKGARCIGTESRFTTHVGVQFYKSTAKRKPTCILHSRFNQISYQNDWGFTQEGDVTSAKVVSSDPNPVPQPSSLGDVNPCHLLSFLQTLLSSSNFETRKKNFFQNMHHFLTSHGYDC